MSQRIKKKLLKTPPNCEWLTIFMPCNYLQINYMFYEKNSVFGLSILFSAHLMPVFLPLLFSFKKMQC